MDTKYHDCLSDALTEQSIPACFFSKESDIFKALKEAYKTVPGSLNTNSLVLYSGPKSGSAFRGKTALGQMFDIKIMGESFSKTLPAGCLYTGDYDAKGSQKFDSLNYAYRDYRKYIGACQLPHHGSYHSYSENLSRRKKCMYIISAGSKNRYNHPHAEVLKSLINKNLFFKIIDEHKRNRVVSRIN